MLIEAFKGLKTSGLHCPKGKDLMVFSVIFFSMVSLTWIMELKEIISIWANSKLGDPTH